MIIGNRDFDTANHTYVMGILNVTPDSFSDGGRYNVPDLALRHTERMIAEGADLIDIGGESTRPGSIPISVDEELTRVMPILEAIKARFDIPLSLDTYKSEVALEGLQRGVDMINDVWGLKADPQMAQTIASYGVPCCLMHNRANPNYDNFEKDWIDDISESLWIAQEAGIAPESIILDPGIGFGKTYDQCLEAVRHLGQFSSLGYPVLLATSRKSFIGEAIDAPVDDRVIGTAVTSVFAVLAGCSFVRVHDVKENVQAIRMARVILTGEP